LDSAKAQGNIKKKKSYILTADILRTFSFPLNAAQNPNLPQPISCSTQLEVQPIDSQIEFRMCLNALAFFLPFPALLFRVDPSFPVLQTAPIPRRASFAPALGRG
jgi:hypothetical protein